jgi:hypothetical protein
MNRSWLPALKFVPCGSGDYAVHRGDDDGSCRSMTMHSNNRKRLEAKGWKVGSTRDGARSIFHAARLPLRPM